MDLLPYRRSKTGIFGKGSKTIPKSESKEPSSGNTIALTLHNDIPLTLTSGSCFSDYSMVSVLGKGTYAQVWKVKCKETDAVYAAKLLQPSQFPKESFNRIIEMFTKEIINLAICQCPGVIKLHKVIGGKEGWLLIQDYADDGTLWKENLTANIKEAFLYFLQLLQGMMYIQDMQILHRDLKPTNVLKFKNDRIVIADFGWSEHVDSCNSHPNEWPGTLEINPPEVLKSTGPMGQKIDNYALGMNMILFISGRFVCRQKGVECSKVASTILKTVHNLRHSKPPSKFRENIKAWDLFLKLTQSSPVERYSLDQVLLHPWVTEMLHGLNIHHSRFIWHEKVKSRWIGLISNGWDLSKSLSLTESKSCTASTASGKPTRDAKETKSVKISKQEPKDAVSPTVLKQQYDLVFSLMKNSFKNKQKGCFFKKDAGEKSGKVAKPEPPVSPDASTKKTKRLGQSQQEQEELRNGRGVERRISQNEKERNLTGTMNRKVSNAMTDKTETSNASMESVELNSENDQTNDEENGNGNGNGNGNANEYDDAHVNGRRSLEMNEMGILAEEALTTLKEKRGMRTAETDSRRSQQKYSVNTEADLFGTSRNDSDTTNSSMNKTERQADARTHEAATGSVADAFLNFNSTRNVCIPKDIINNELVERINKLGDRTNGMDSLIMQHLKGGMLKSVEAHASNSIQTELAQVTHFNDNAASGMNRYVAYGSENRQADRGDADVGKARGGVDKNKGTESGRKENAVDAARGTSQRNRDIDGQNDRTDSEPLYIYKEGILYSVDLEVEQMATETSGMKMKNQAAKDEMKEDELSGLLYDQIFSSVVDKSADIRFRIIDHEKLNGPNGEDAAGPREANAPFHMNCIGRTNLTKKLSKLTHIKETIENKMPRKDPCRGAQYPNASAQNFFDGPHELVSERSRKVDFSKGDSKDAATDERMDREMLNQLRYRIDREISNREYNESSNSCEQIFKSIQRMNGNRSDKFDQFINDRFALMKDRFLDPSDRTQMNKAQQERDDKSKKNTKTFMDLSNDYAKGFYSHSKISTSTLNSNLSSDLNNIIIEKFVNQTKGNDQLLKNCFNELKTKEGISKDVDYLNRIQFNKGVDMAKQKGELSDKEVARILTEKEPSTSPTQRTSDVSAQGDYHKDSKEQEECVHILNYLMADLSHKYPADPQNAADKGAAQGADCLMERTRATEQGASRVDMSTAGFKNNVNNASKNNAGMFFSDKSDALRNGSGSAARIAGSFINEWEEYKRRMVNEERAEKEMLESIAVQNASYFKRILLNYKEGMNRADFNSGVKPKSEAADREHCVENNVNSKSHLYHYMNQANNGMKYKNGSNQNSAVNQSVNNFKGSSIHMGEYLRENISKASSASTFDCCEFNNYSSGKDHMNQQKVKIIEKGLFQRMKNHNGKQRFD